MKYKNNPNYTVEHETFSALTDHMERMSERYSDLIPLRMDFAYKRDSARYRQRYCDHWDMDVYRLAERVLRNKSVVGYCWAMEFTQTHGLHFHALFYLNGQLKRNSYRTARIIAEEWRDITNEAGIFDNSQKKLYHKVNGARNLHYSDKKGFRDLAFILSYLAKQEQKERFELPVYWLSDISPRGRGGRTRSTRCV